MKVSIITPTLNRNPQTVKRCLYSVRSQILTDWEQLVFSDGMLEPNIKKMMDDDFDKRQIYKHSECNQGHFGAGIRNYGMKYCKGKYLSFLDDDNVLFPDYLKKMARALDENTDCGFAISRTVHMGPLPPHMGEPPKLLTGIPPIIQNIDTIQIMVRKEAMEKCGWVLEGYFSDGFTYQKLGEMFKYVEVPELLSIHL